MINEKINNQTLTHTKMKKKKSYNNSNQQNIINN